MKIIYDAILARIAAEIPELRYVDLDKGQFEQDRPPVTFPALLVSLQIPSTQENHRTNLHKQVMVTFRVGWDFWGNTSNITPTPNRSQSLEYFDLIEKIERTFQGWDDGSRRFNYFSQMALREERLRPDIKIVNIPFKTSYHDQKP
jgi:hypothetical protein